MTYLHPRLQTNNLEPMPLNIAITNEEKILVTLTPVTAAGNPATLDGVPTWVSDNTDVATVQVADDGLSAYIISGNVGTANVTVTADADLDEGEERELSDVVAVTILGAEAASLGFGAGSGEPK